MPGPVASPNSRRNQGKNLGGVVLPFEGRPGKAPAWPLEGRAPAGWAALWKMPQAVEWERLRCVEEVANYLLVRTAAREALECGEPNAALFGEVRQCADRLGLTPMSLKRLGWDIAEQVNGEVRSVDAKRQERFLKLL